MQLAFSKIKFNANVLRITKLALFAGLTAVGAAIEIPFWPVPITMQTLAVMLAGLYLGAKDGALSQIVYLSAGLVLPVFSGAGFGLASLLGPTGGYLLMFPVLAFSTGLLFRSHAKTITKFIGLNLINAAFLLIGSLWLIVVLQASFYQAIVQGALLFMLGDALKVGTVVLLGSLKTMK